ncbi:chromodomain-helicase-DNA-binding protein 1 [Monoraphidium neglectum]|uniref:Chromodomain-helicase-DNA-binding protein 1 n=1 Tax=Monoraphidium neglectum TaxID=145388 RepID=A0A0D2IYC9_9CHLO|nr:chromodomain-helicase-DNA-binding protein 1 [Monoraphidium neglectum]KIY92937.1 chromodomain-helicase-DNA-binding protein 1 [Monoraphidium neglectum]|eukprot:XP_013891957.1 chromodomain-helicase-DNA-binding protein 1 [Monoraphidium neglectum]
MDASGRTVLEPGGNKASAKQLFGKEELAAIMRFGAEDLFKGAAEEQEAARQQQRAMLEEDIDAILERAEVVEAREGEGEEGAAADLLGSFNVATFNTAEDDATFWERLIPPEERVSLEERDELLLPRAARLKPEDREALGLAPASASEDDSGSDGGGRDRRARGGGGAGGGGGGKRRGAAARSAGAGKKKHVSGAEPGPAIEGAALRVDEWLLDVDEEGRPQQEGTPAPGGGKRASGSPRGGSPDPAPANVRTISRRDAAAFVRAVRRYGLPQRLPAIAAEVGPALEDAPPRQRLSLWRSLVDGCRTAVDETPEDAKDAMLDFFGVPVKAQELLNHLAQMKLLAKQLLALEDAGQQLPRAFRLEAGAAPPAPKWGPAVGWGAADDAALLVGVFWHGIGHWEGILGDPRLGLAGKLSCVLAPPQKPAAPAATPPPDGGGEAAAAAAADKEAREKEHLPKGGAGGWGRAWPWGLQGFGAVGLWGCAH